MGSGLRRLATVVVGLTAVVAAGVAPAVLAPDVASAASGDFYQAPSPLLPAQSGAIIRTQPATVVATALTATTTTVMYHSRDAQDHDIAVTGTVFSPLAAWLGPGPRPWVDLAVGTQGALLLCA